MLDFKIMILLAKLLSGRERTTVDGLSLYTGKITVPTLCSFPASRYILVMCMHVQRGLMYGCNRPSLDSVFCTRVSCAWVLLL